MTEFTVDTTQKGFNGLKICYHTSRNVSALLLHKLTNLSTKNILKATKTVSYIHCKLLSLKKQTLTIFINIGLNGQYLLEKRLDDCL